MVYDQENDELFVPEYGKNLLGFLKNPGLLNWKVENPDEKFLLSGEEKEFTRNLKIIIANNTIAEYLALSYLIIKSKDDAYWNILSTIMQDDPHLSDLIFNNRNAYEYNSFNDLLLKWQTAFEKDNLPDLVNQLQQDGKLGNDDLTMQLIAYNPKGKEFITSHETVKTKNNPVENIPIKPEPGIETIISDTFIKSHKFNKDKESFINFILDNKIKSLYHFTDKSNIESIKKLGGLFSWEYMLQKGIIIPKPGGDNLSRMLDSRYGLQDYVRTSFCKTHPMMHIAFNEGRIQNPIILEIDPTIIILAETLFSDINATRKGHQKGGNMADLKKVRLDICLSKDYFSIEEYEKQYYQAEVMVKSFIPINYILNL
jgi:hypothetical protein